MNPGEHGEVFVTEDGGETDLDLGHYERFIDENLSKRSNTTTGGDLQLGHREGAPRRLPRTHRPGHPARDRRDQGPHPAPGRRGRRHRHRRDRRHGRRHRDRALRRGDPPVPPGHRPGQRLLRPPHAGALPRVGRAEDQADPALGDRAAQPRYPARRDRLPQRQAHLREPEAQDLPAVRRPHRRRRLGRRRAEHLRDPARPARAGTRRLRLPHARHRRGAPTRSTSPSGRRWSAASSRCRAGCKVGIVGKYVNMPDAYMSVVEALRHAGFHHGAEVELDWIDAELVPGTARHRPAARPRRHRDPGRLRRARHRGHGGRGRATPATTASRASACAWACT